MLDVVTGLLLMLATLALLGTVLTRTSITARRLADDRAAVRQAETALLTLSANDKVDAAVTIRLLDDPAPEGHRWASASATSRSRGITLIGLLPTTRPAAEVAP